MSTQAGERVALQKQTVVVEECQTCKALMVNIDAQELRPGDLVLLKGRGVRISNPDTTDPICLNCDLVARPSRRERITDWFRSPSKSTDDDSSFFNHSSSSGGFGGFGGGVFSGGGAGRGF